MLSVKKFQLLEEVKNIMEAYNRERNLNGLTDLKY